VLDRRGEKGIRCVECLENPAKEQSKKRLFVPFFYEMKLADKSKQTGFSWEGFGRT
jgi:hypothetical protein